MATPGWSAPPQESSSDSADSAATGNSADKDKSPAADKPQVSSGEVLGFDQAEIAAKMTELEQRMFRLAEALKGLEPENASRLTMALKYAREELILLEMRETRDLLKELELGTALTREKQIVAKLQRLQDLLLSLDLDFAMRLDRLRQMRELLRQMDVAIGQQQQANRGAASARDKQEEVARLRKKKATVEELIAEQTAHEQQGKRLAAKPSLDGDDRTALANLARQQDRTRLRTKLLSGDHPQSQSLTAAEQSMAKAGQPLSQDDPAAAVPHQSAALAQLKQAGQKTAGELKDKEQELNDRLFENLGGEQAANQALAERMASGAGQLGASGQRAQSELIRAGGAMGSAVNYLRRRQAQQAGPPQQQALNSLRHARDDLAREAEALLESMRAEIRIKVIETLTQMHERQKAIREATEKLVPQVAQKQRQALSQLPGFAEAEGQIIASAEGLVELVEETEFAVALPATMKIVARSMQRIQADLTAGKADDAVVTLQRQVEGDLLAMLDAMKRMPAKGKSSGNSQRGSPGERERELNRLVAELKMIRLLQVRVNEETSTVDGRRLPDAEQLSQSLREAIQRVEESQNEVQGTTQRLGEVRGK